MSDATLVIIITYLELWFFLSLFLILQIFISKGGSTLILDGKSMYFCEDVLSGFGEELFDIHIKGTVA
jgi:hypothetical protein